MGGGVSLPRGSCRISDAAAHMIPDTTLSQKHEFALDRPSYASRTSRVEPSSTASPWSSHASGLTPNVESEIDRKPHLLLMTCAYQPTPVKPPDQELQQTLIFKCNDLLNQIPLGFEDPRVSRCDDRGEFVEFPFPRFCLPGDIPQRFVGYFQGCQALRRTLLM